MTKEIIIDGELSCNNCLEKTRCKQQQEAKEQRIDAILSYIVNEDNEKYIAELKNEIPSLTRCDVVLEKQLKRLKQENEKLKQENEYYITKQNQLLDDKDFQSEIIEELRNQLEEVYENCNKFTDCSYIQGKNDIINQYKQTLEEIRDIADKVCISGCKCIDKRNILNKINEVLK